MRSLRLGTALLLAATSAITFAQTAPTPASAPDRAVITPATMEAHVTFLADDLLEGRDTGTRGYDIAARYVATQYKALGLEPAVSGDWYQQVAFERSAPSKSSPPTLTIGEAAYPHGSEVVFQGLKDGTAIKGDAVFVGHGIVSPEHGLDDYAGLDVKGKTVIMFFGAPASIPAEVAAKLSSERTKLAAARGATSALLIFDSKFLSRYPWAMVRREAGGNAVRLAAGATPTDKPEEARTPGGAISHAAAQALFAGAPRDFKTVLAEADSGKPIKGFALARPVAIGGSIDTHKFTSPNVVGMIPGSDPALKGEAVLLMAHLDHVGVRPNAEGEDKIFNGAMDNASGVASMLEVARAFQASGRTPRRTILFAAVTGEEHGLFGSQYLARNPVIEGQKVVSVVNLDMPVLLYDFTDVVAFGAEHSTMGPIVAKAAASEGVTLSPDPMPEENLFMRSDHYSFVQTGVPSVFLVTGFANGGETVFRDFLKTHYHQASDQVDLPFDWNAAAKFARVNYAIAREMADIDAAPRWYADSPFAKTAPDLPTAPRPAGETPTKK